MFLISMVAGSCTGYTLGVYASTLDSTGMKNRIFMHNLFLQKNPTIQKLINLIYLFFRNIYYGNDNWSTYESDLVSFLDNRNQPNSISNVVWCNTGIIFLLRLLLLHSRYNNRSLK